MKSNIIGPEGERSDVASVRSEKTISDLTHGLSNLYPLPKKVEGRV